MSVRRARTPVEDVSTVLRLQLRDELVSAAGGNALLSRTEQRSAMPHFQEAAEEIRAAGGPNARVTVDSIEENLTAKAMRLIDAVNQPSGAGAPFLSKAEARDAFLRGGRVGEAVLRAYEVASGNGLDVDELARLHVNRDISTDVVFKTFATEAEATSYAEPTGKSVRWLVAVSDGLVKKSFVCGSNDLWSERFDIDRLTGALTVTGEH